MPELSWVDWLVSAGVPRLPALWLMRWSMAIGWALVFACLGAVLTRRYPQRTRHTVALVLAAWAAWDDPASPGHWLGLAFQSPSLASMLLLALAYGRMVFPEPVAQQVRKSREGLFWVVTVGVVVGSVLLLDLLAVWPGSLYAWGFGPAALVLALTASLLPAIAGGFTWSRYLPEVWVVPAALLLFAATRLPTGNVWDALIDPWLWLFFVGWLLRSLVRKARGKTPAHPV